MKLGIFSKTYTGKENLPLEALARRIKNDSLDAVQFNFSDAGVDTLPYQEDALLCDSVKNAFDEAGIEIAAVSGTFNMIHPDDTILERDITHFQNCIRCTNLLDTRCVTLCTGTFDPHNKWRYHPDNSAPEAWKRLCRTMERVLPTAEENRVILCVEPEVSNVIDSAGKARRLLDEMASDFLKIVIDGANLFHTGELARMDEILDKAFELLGDDIVLAHAKDLSSDGHAGDRAAGTGLLDYDRYLHLLASIGYEGALILHSLSEQQVPESVRFLRKKSMGTEVV